MKTNIEKSGTGVLFLRRGIGGKVLDCHNDCTGIY